MTPDEVLAFARALPHSVTRVEIVGVLVIEQQPVGLVRTVPDVGDATKASAAKEKAARRSDVDSLGLESIRELE